MKSNGPIDVQLPLLAQGLDSHAGMTAHAIMRSQSWQFHQKCNELTLTFCAIVSGAPETLPTLNCTITVACVVSIHTIILGSAKSSTVCSIVILLTHHSKYHIQNNSVHHIDSSVCLI